LEIAGYWSGDTVLARKFEDVKKESDFVHSGRTSAAPCGLANVASPLKLTSPAAPKLTTVIYPPRYWKKIVDESIFQAGSL